MKRFGVFFFTIAAVVLLCLGTMLVRSPQVRAQNDNNQGNQGNQGNDDEFKIKQGFAIAPVPLNLDGKDPSLVGLGSYVTPSIPASNIHLRGEIHICFRPPSAER